MSEQAEKGEWPSTTLPESWSWASFHDAWSDSTDSTRKLKQKEYLAEGPLPVVDQGESLVGGFTDRNDLKNDVALPCIVFGDHTRSVKFIDFEFAQGADGVKVLQPNDQYDPEFAYQALRCVRLPNKGYSRHFKFLKSTAFPIPPIPEQRRIVAKLDRLSARSAAARDHLARTTKLATRAKQEIRGAAFDGSLTSDWREALGRPTPGFRPLESVCASLTDGDHQAPPKADEGIAFITISAINDGYLRLEKATRYVPQSYRDGLKHTRQAVEGDILFSVTGSIAIPALVDTSEPFVFQRHIAILKPDHDAVTSRYLLHILGATQVKEQALAVATGTAQLTIPLGKLRKFSIPIPPLEEQVEIVHRIETAFARIDRMTEEASRAAHLLERLDERLLAKAFRGKLVPQDPDDEPAEALLTRIREARAAAPKAKQGRRKKAAAK